MSFSKKLSEPVVKRSCCCCRTYYENPWATQTSPSLWAVMKSIPGWCQKPSRPKAHEIEENIAVETPDAEQLSTPPTDGSIQFTWLGHATCLVQLDGFTVIADPIMSQRSSFSNYIGPKRYTRAPLQVQDLPNIDAVVISHNHYDHLDSQTVQQLHERFGEKLKWFVPLGLKRWFTDRGIDNTTEMSWWDSEDLRSNSGEELKFVCVPAQHFSNRALHDSGWTLWSGWVIIGKESRFYFAGDTGYCEAFKEIGMEYGPFTAAAIPIGAYAPRMMMQRIHVDPEEAVKIHQDVRSHKSIGIHWGTFDLAAEGVFAPRESLKECMSEAGLNQADFITIPPGGVLTIPSNQKTGLQTKKPLDISRN